MKKRLLCILAFSAFLVNLSACQSDSAEQVSPMVDSVVNETMQVEFTTQTTETTATENSEETQAEENTYKNIETVVIAGQEIPIDAESVTLYLSEDCDVSSLKMLKKIKHLNLSNGSEGVPPTISGFDVLTGCESINSLGIQVILDNPNDICILETMPNLSSISIWGIEAYDFGNFNLPSIKSLSILGTFDGSKISHLTNLTSLSMEYNLSTDLSFLSNFPEIAFLEITECGFTDYSCILDLKNLEWLFISSYPMTEEMYNQIKRQHPECEITIVNDFVD